MSSSGTSCNSPYYKLGLSRACHLSFSGLGKPQRFKTMRYRLEKPHEANMTTDLAHRAYPYHPLYIWNRRNLTAATKITQIISKFTLE